MCLISFALNQHPDYPLILIANRDEFLNRPTAPLHVWQDQSGIVGGRDNEAGGTWLAINKTGRWAALTNFRNPSEPPAEHSRGALVVDCLESDLSLESWFKQMERNYTTGYAGYNFVAGEYNTEFSFYYSNVERKVRRLSNGHYAISNGRYDDDWPKMKYLREKLANQISGKDVEVDRLFELLTHDQLAAQDQLPNTGIPIEFEKRLSAPFIQPFKIMGRDYGTRSSAALVINKLGKVDFYERTVIEENSSQTSESWSIKQQ
ncbi:MAG: NRDE family protein [Kangiellaceae bacterium]|jgi:uncharacterized protein with NRDE domain|nr:NRDE family protein [Kangiellaceae bacterium]